LRPLVIASARMFPAFVQKVQAAGGMQAGFRRTGTIALLRENAAPREYRYLSSAELHLLEPSINNAGHSAFFAQEDSVDPLLLTRAALAAARSCGVEIQGHAAVTEIRARDNSVEIVTERDTFSTAAAVDCRGAWSGAPVRPRKGQMLYVYPETSVLQHVLRAPDVYIVPRSSGKILIGATLEDIGFDKSVDPSAIRDLQNLAAKYVPALASARVTQSWAGLRPGTPDDLPILGKTDIPGIFVATGHFRNGILLAPITAHIMADLIHGHPSPLDIHAFSPDRFHRTRK